MLACEFASLHWETKRLCFWVLMYRVLVVDMFNEYDKPLHAPSRMKMMKSPGQELDEQKVDAAISSLISDLGSEDDLEPEPGRDLPELAAQEEVDEIVDEAPATEENGVKHLLRQTWAHLSGAA